MAVAEVKLRLADIEPVKNLLGRMARLVESLDGLDLPDASRREIAAIHAGLRTAEVSVPNSATVMWRLDHTDSLARQNEVLNWLIDYDIPTDGDMDIQSVRVEREDGHVLTVVIDMFDDTLRLPMTTPPPGAEWLLQQPEQATGSTTVEPVA